MATDPAGRKPTLRTRAAIVRELVEAKSGDAATYERLVQELRDLNDRRSPFDWNEGKPSLKSGWLPSNYEPVFERLLELARQTRDEGLERFVEHSAWCASQRPSGKIQRNRETQLLRAQFVNCRNSYCIDTRPSRALEHFKLKYNDVLAPAVAEWKNVSAWSFRFGLNLPGASPGKLVQVAHSYQCSKDRGGHSFGHWLGRKDGGREPLVTGPWVGAAHLAFGSALGTPSTNQQEGGPSRRSRRTQTDQVDQSATAGTPALVWSVLVAVDSGNKGQVRLDEVVKRWRESPRHRKLAGKDAAPWVQFEPAAWLHPAWERVLENWARDFWADSKPRPEVQAHKLRALQHRKMNLHGFLGDVYGHVGELREEARDERQARSDKDEWEDVSKIEDLLARDKPEVLAWVHVENEKILRTQRRTSSPIDNGATSVVPSIQDKDDKEAEVTREELHRTVKQAAKEGAEEGAYAGVKRALDEFHAGRISEAEFKQRISQAVSRKVN